MEKFDSITHFLQSGGFEYRVFDMGRKLIPMSNKDFDDFENQKEAYPYPLQQKAWFALLFWSSEDGSEPVIWFLQFPIDEMGFLKQEARDGFLIDLLEQAGKNIQANLSGGNADDDLRGSPYAFKPQEDRLAMIHAFSNKSLGREASRYYQATREYLLGSLGFDQWQFLGLQGIADVVVNLEQNENAKILAKALPLMPDVPLAAFCRALENAHPEGVLIEALVSRLDQEIVNNKAGDSLLLSVLLRAISGSQVKEVREFTYLKVLNSSMGSELEVLVAISARSWGDLRCLDVLSVFMANLARQDQVAFNVVLTDLLMIPEVKGFLLSELEALKNMGEFKSRLSNFYDEVKSK